MDDRSDNLRALEVALEAVDADTVPVASGEEALGQLLTDEFAAILLDVRMPGLGGLETARLIRARPATRHVPIIFVTGLEPEAELVRQAYALGAVDFVTKPMDVEALRAKVAFFVDLFQHARAARQSRERYDTLSEIIPVGVFHTSIDGDCLWVNSRWCEISGLSPDEARGKGWSKAIHPDDRERVFQEWYLAAKEGAQFLSEYRFRGKGGAVTWVLGQARAEVDTAGRMIGYVGTITDITDRKEKEEELRAARTDLERRVEERTRDLAREYAERSKAEGEAVAAQGRLRLVIDQVPALISYIDREGRYVYANQTYEAWLGRPVESVRGKHLRDVLGVESFEKIRPQVEAALQGQTVEYEDELPYPNGRRAIRAAYVPDRSPSGEVSGFVALVTDVTERKAREEREKMLSEASAALASSLDYEETVRQIAEVAARGIAEWCIVDLVEAGAVRRLAVAHRDPAKAAWAREYSERHPIDPGRSTAVGRVLRTGAAELYAEVTDEVLRASARDEEHLRMLRQVGITSAMIVPIEARGTPVGALSMVSTQPARRYGEEDLALARELGRRAGLALDNARLLRHLQELTRTLERRVEERTADVQEAMRQLESFAYTIAHDLRAPARAMTGFSQALLEDYGERLDREGLDYLQRIHDAGRRMDAMIQDLLDYSRIVRGELPLGEVDLGSTVDRALSELAPELSQAKAVVAVDRPLPRVRAHELTLTLAIQNLVSNAAKFVAPGVEPRIRIRAEARGAGGIRLWVEDNGIGIPAEHHERIFGVFERLHQPDEYPGTGIGLAIVRKAMERMGGRSGLESEPGKGSRFFLDFPAGA